MIITQKCLNNFIRRRFKMFKDEEHNLRDLLKKLFSNSKHTADVCDGEEL